MGLNWEFKYNTGNYLGNSWEYDGNRTGTGKAYFDVKAQANGLNFLVEKFVKIKKFGLKIFKKNKNKILIKFIGKWIENFDVKCRVNGLNIGINKWDKKVKI